MEIGDARENITKSRKLSKNKLNEGFNKDVHIWTSDDEKIGKTEDKETATEIRKVRSKTKEQRFNTPFSKYENMKKIRSVLHYHY